MREPHALGRRAIGIVDVDDERHALEGLAHLRGDRRGGSRVGPVDLGKQRRQHRRARRRLDHLDDGAGRHVDARQALAHLERDLVAGAAALALRREVDLDVALIGAERR